MNDDDLRRHVAAELSWDSQVGSEAIEVSAASGVVTLRGTVASFWLKRAGAGPRYASRRYPDREQTAGNRSRTKTVGTTRTCAATCWRR